MFCRHCQVTFFERPICPSCSRPYLPELRLTAKVPEAILSALARVSWQYSSPAHVFHCIQLDLEHYVGVAGDGNNGGYEWFVFRDGKLTTSDAGYGWTAYALREVLNQEVAS